MAEFTTMRNLQEPERTMLRRYWEQIDTLEYVDSLLGSFPNEFLHEPEEEIPEVIIESIPEPKFCDYYNNNIENRFKEMEL